MPSPYDSFDLQAVRDRMKEMGITQSDLAREMKLNQSAISNLLNGGRAIKAHEAAFLQRRLNLGPPSLIDLVPVLGLSNASNWREAIAMPSKRRVPVPPGMAGENSFAIELLGDSLDQVIQCTYLVVDPDKTQLFNGKVYLIENAEHETTVKVYQSNPARFEPRSSNDQHQPIMVGEQPVRVIGRIVWQGSPV